jgi:signal peptidase I
MTETQKSDISKEKAAKNTIKSVVREWVESIVIAFILAMFIRTFFIQAFKIPSGSMRMTLVEGDRLMVNKLRYGARLPFTDIRLPGFHEPQRGDIIVFVYPEDKKRDFIKRLIAFGGETIEIRGGNIYINGQMVQDPEIKNIYYYNRGDYGSENLSVEVPIGHVFVLGDNSGSSHDSRYWGFVPQKNIVGRAEFIYWPLKRMRWIHQDENSKK